MRFGVFASIVFHLALVGSVYLDLWPFEFRPTITPEPYIPLELIREAELSLRTSVPAAAPEPVEEEIEEPDLPEPEAEEEPPAPQEQFRPEEAAQQEPEEPVVEKAPDPVAETPEPQSEEKPEPPKETPTVKPKPQQTAELDLDALSQLIDREKEKQAERPREAPSETTETADQARSAIGAGDRLTASDRAKMKAAVERCWNASAIIGAPEPEKLRVEILIELNRDGTLATQPRVENALEINLSGNRFWKVAEQSALRAVVSCAPYDIFPQDRYQDWKSFLLNFDPSQMVGR